MISQDINLHPGYASLARVLRQAYLQAAEGKGKERHACGRPFLEQPMMTISRMTGVGGPIYQAMKKAQESLRLPHDRAIAECYGAIIYLAGAVLLLEEMIAEEEKEIDKQLPQHLRKLG